MIPAVIVHWMCAERRTALSSAIARPLRFAETGLAAASFQLALLVLLTGSGWNALAANVCAFLLAAQLNFVLSSCITWRDRLSLGSLPRRWLMFHASIALMAVLNMLVFDAVRSVAAPIVASALGITAGALGNYVMGDRLVFRGSTVTSSLSNDRKFAA